MTTTIKTKLNAHKEIINLLNAETFEDGTYDIETLAPVSFKRGYQVTFCEENADYTAEEYDTLCAIFEELSMDGKTYAGKFGGTPEISFRVESKKLAKRLAKRFNQISVWNWKYSKEIKTGGTGRR